MVEKVLVLNWAYILSFKILNIVKAIKEALNGINPGFFMSS